MHQSNKKMKSSGPPSNMSYCTFQVLNYVHEVQTQNPRFPNEPFWRHKHIALGKFREKFEMIKKSNRSLNWI